MTNTQMTEKEIENVRIPIITIKQPYASLIVNGFADMLIRRNPSKFMGSDVLIYADSRPADSTDIQHMKIVMAAYYGALVPEELEPDVLPYGQIIGSATLDSSYRINKTIFENNVHRHCMPKKDAVNAIHGWFFRNVRKLHHPIKYDIPKGSKYGKMTVGMLSTELERLETDEFYREIKRVPTEREKAEVRKWAGVDKNDA